MSENKMWYQAPCEFERQDSLMLHHMNPTVLTDIAVMDMW